MSARSLAAKPNRAARRAVAAGAASMPPFGPAERERFIEQLWELEATLVAAGFHSLSPWWREQIERFVRSGCRRWVIRAGRRAGKSSALARLAVAVWLFGAWSVPRGDIAVIPFISVSKDESGARLRTICEILDVLNVEYEQRGEEIEVTSPRALIFRAIACTAKASVGFTACFIVADEQALWESRETMANPAPEVMGHLNPTTATQPHAWIVESSAPHGTDDYHAASIERGDTDHQRVSFAPTWVANPTLTEADTHALEPDDRMWSMRYAAIPGATVTAALDPEDVAACFDWEIAA